MRQILLNTTSVIISISFGLLFFFVPLLFTPLNYELFEYNKMMGVYALTVVIGLSWLIKMILEEKFEVRRNPLDLPLLLFLLSQIISTFLSIDRHVSIFGYYSRFNGGLLSTMSYIILYYAFLNNISKESILKYIKIIIASAVLVVSYGILEHFGIDKNIWVQDVQNRVFSSFGQPNWLAAYLAVLIPLAVALGLQKLSVIKYQLSISGLFDAWSANRQTGIYWLIGGIFYITLIFTRSRSGFAGFWIADLIFWLVLFLRYKKNILKTILIFNLSLVILNFLIGTPFSQLDRFTLSRLVQKSPSVQPAALPPSGSSVLETGITESGTIRQIVWKGAIDIIRHYPVFGSGVETFAFSYYRYRPVEHNMTSEWDFLYNKAHNEYLNYGATTGLVGLGCYLLLIVVFIAWNIKTIKIQNLDFGRDLKLWILPFGLFCGWLSILVTNFLGFSVVFIQILFFLIPAMLFVLDNPQKKLLYNWHTRENSAPLSFFQSASSFALLLTGFYLLFSLGKMWFADVAYARGYNLDKAGNFAESFQYLRGAITLNPHEPLYFDEISLPTAELAVAANEQKESSLSAQLLTEAVNTSNIAIHTSPNNVNFWKTRTRVYYALSAMNPQYITSALAALTRAAELSPTDPKIYYNLGLLYGKIGKFDEAIFNLDKSARLKPDYKDAHFALALFYKETKQTDKARSELNFILTKISTSDADTKKQLEELR